MFIMDLTTDLPFLESFHYYTTFHFPLFSYSLTVYFDFVGAGEGLVLD
jgi:hypothetical protein